MTKELAFAVIGGFGLYNMPGLEILEERTLSTPFGEPSSPIIIGNMEGQKIAFLARHGLKHQLNPSEVNYRANIYALKSIGGRWRRAVSACGSLREDYAPCHLVIPDQLFDFPPPRARYFFASDLVAHVDVADPFCSDFNQQLLSASQMAEDAKVHSGGNYITIEGPRFSTRA